MKILRSALRMAPLLTPAFKVLKSKTTASTLTAVSLATGYAYMFGTQKVFAEEVSTFEVEDNLQEGEMKEIQVGPKPEDTVLLVKHQDQYYCVQSKCSHFGFPLAKGLLVGDKVICPLHNAGFDVKTGLAEQGPILDGLKTFPVERRDGKVIVSVPKNGWDTKPQRPVLGENNVDKNKRYVIIGAGPAAISAAETLRDTGYNGLIYLVSKEK